MKKGLPIKFQTIGVVDLVSPLHKDKTWKKKLLTSVKGLENVYSIKK